MNELMAGGDTIDEQLRSDKRDSFSKPATKTGKSEIIKGAQGLWHTCQPTKWTRLPKYSEFGSLKISKTEAFYDT